MSTTKQEVDHMHEAHKKNRVEHYQEVPEKNSQVWLKQSAQPFCSSVISGRPRPASGGELAQAHKEEVAPFEP